MKRKPTGFVATCQCGKVVGALHYERTGRAEAGKIIGKWLHDGCVVAPLFEDSWSVMINACECQAGEGEE